MSNDKYQRGDAGVSSAWVDSEAQGPSLRTFGRDVVDGRWFAGVAHLTWGEWDTLKGVIERRREEEAQQRIC